MNKKLAVLMAVVAIAVTSALAAMNKSGGWRPGNVSHKKPH